MTGSTRNSPWQNMIVSYKEMGLSDEEIANRIICKATKIINGQPHLGERDHKQTLKTKEMER